MGHVLSGWLPASPEVLARIYSKMNTGEYREDSSKVIEDLKLDFGSFGRVLSQIRPPADSVHGFIAPVADVGRLSVEKLVGMIPKSPALVSRHRLQNGSASLRSTLTCSLQSAAAAETFAAAAAEKGTAIDSQEAFGASMLRQFGINLLAWNYPTVLFRILKNLAARPAERDAELKRLLGFTPLSLAAAIARRWNIKPVLVDAIEPKPGPTGINALHEICDLGDSFGRKHHSGLYPTAERDWSERRERLIELIGSQNSREVTERVEAKLEKTLDTVFKFEPRRFNQAFASVRPTQKKAIYLENPFLRRLPEEAGRRLAKVHENLRGEGGVISALSELTAAAIPQSGFVRGLICVRDQESQTLRLAVRIGLRPDDTGRIRRLAAAAIEARESSVPLLNEVRVGGEKVTRISSSFGGPSSGVLVLELSNEAAEDPRRDNLAYFQAVRRCLECCLDTEAKALSV